MASLIPGYEYDIFISYRQKDNKHDGWVTEFVENLKGELESTFKEEVSVYFDINPHDGLLETHDVDATLKAKLKCLIFIPIISRTYCDPKSFAWEHEFKDFVEMASHDQFGLKIKLPNGNVASRVLPVLIHDLDTEDRTLVQKELDGFLRGIEFFYTEPGVNRPLMANEGNPDKNLNKTFYRNQINKVANAIKEIIAALKNPGQTAIDTSEKHTESVILHHISQRSKIIAGSLLIITLIITGYLVLNGIYNQEDRSGKSIAVLPFHNYSEDQTQEYMSDGLTDEIINHLYQIRSFGKVVSLSTVLTFKGTDKKIPEIANELKVDYILEGTYKKIGDKVRINALLIDPKSDNYIWRHEYDQPAEEIMAIQADIALQIADQVNAYLTNSEKQKIQKMPTVNPDAYDLYMQGRYLWNKRTREGLFKSIEFFEKSVAIDPGYALAFSGLADAYNTLVFWGWLPRQEGFQKAKEYATKALTIDPGLAEARAELGDILIWSEWKWDEALKELKLAIELNPNCAVAHGYYSEYLDIMRRNKEAREEINIALRLDPASSAFNGTSSLYFYNEGRFSESLETCLKLLEINPDYIKNYYICMFNYMNLGDDQKAFNIFQKLMSRDTLTAGFINDLKDIFSKYGIKGIINWIIKAEQMKPEPSAMNLAWAYSSLGNREETIKWLKKAYEQRSVELPRINNYYIFRDMHSDTAFMNIIKQMGLTVNTTN